MEDNSEVLRELSSVKTKIEMHMQQDSEIFAQLRDMHKTHFSGSKEQGEAIATLLGELKAVKEDNAETKAAIEKHTDNHGKFYFYMLTVAAGGLVSTLVWLVQKAR